MHLDHDPEESGATADVDPQLATRAAGPAAERRTRWASIRRWTYVVLIFLMGMATANPGPSDLGSATGEYVEAYNEGYYGGQIMGAGFGALLVSFAVAALFMGWRKSTRRLIPGTAFVVAVLSFLGTVGGDAMETETQVSALRQWTLNPEAATLPANDPPPRALEARIAWATRHALQDIAEYGRALAAEHDIDPNAAPEGWLSAAYLADAGKHPEVREYFTRYRRYLQEQDGDLSMYAERMEARLRQAGLGQRDLQEVMAEVRKERAEAEPDVRRRTERQLAVSAAALNLHAYLERVDSRVHLDEAAGIARFVSDAERTRAQELIEEVQQLAAASAAAHREQRSETGTQASGNASGS